MIVEFKYVMLMVKDVLVLVKFYLEGLGLMVKIVSLGWVELDVNGMIIVFYVVENL